MGAVVYFIRQERNLRSFGNCERSEIEIFRTIVDSVRIRIMGLKLKGTADVIKASEIWCFPIDKTLKYMSMLKDMDSDHMITDGEFNCADVD